MSVPEALAYADRLNLDLVEVAPMANPPVCKVMDYGKYRYEQEQKAKEARKRQTTISIKEIKLRPKIDDHDFDTKKGHVERFLKTGRQGQADDHVPRQGIGPPASGRETAPPDGRGSGGHRRGRVRAQSRRQEHGHDAGPEALTGVRALREAGSQSLGDEGNDNGEEQDSQGHQEADQGDRHRQAACAAGRSAATC